MLFSVKLMRYERHTAVIGCLPVCYSSIAFSACQVNLAVGTQRSHLLQRLIYQKRFDASADAAAAWPSSCKSSHRIFALAALSSLQPLYCTAPCHYYRLRIQCLTVYYRCRTKVRGWTRRDHLDRQRCQATWTTTSAFMPSVLFITLVILLCAGADPGMGGLGGYFPTLVCADYSSHHSYH